MGHVNRTGVTEKDQIWKKSFGRVHFSNFILKRTKIQKKSPLDVQAGQHRDGGGLGEDRRQQIIC
jgi:hypothetical protein